MENRMTKEEYESRLAQWAENAKREMAGIIHSKTHGKGELEKIKVSVKEDSKTTSHYAGFNFNRYGVFVAYGVGRGWIRQNGRVAPGSRVKKGSEMEAQLKKRGYQKREIRQYAVGGEGSGHARKPVDWFDSVLLAHIEELGNIAAEYYGDKALEAIVDVLNRSTIKKNYSTSDII